MAAMIKGSSHSFHTVTNGKARKMTVKRRTSRLYSVKVRSLVFPFDSMMELNGRTVMKAEAFARKARK
jgi:hypothetical protein